MLCRNCQEPLPPDSGFCPKCGTPIAAPPPSPRIYHVRDRGALIVALGILSILIFGPITGVPGWLLANGDLRDIRSGLIPLEAGGTVRTGRTLNIIGTFCSLISLVVLFILAVIAFVFFEMAIVGTSVAFSVM